MDLKSVNRLLAHSPWSQHEYAQALAQVTGAAEVGYRQSKRRVDLLFATAAALAGLGALRLFSSTGTEGLRFALLGAGLLLAYVALRAAYGRTTVGEAVERWTRDEGVAPLTPGEIELLHALAATRPEALQRIRAWEALGLVLRRRDRASIEGYLATQGVAVPARDEGDLAMLDAEAA